MMRMTALVFVCASFVTGCSWGEGSGEDDPTPDAGPSGGGNAVCGDTVCAASEVGSCTSDCGSGGGATNPVCGNNTCETGESTASCPNDCGGGSGSGSGSGSGTTGCGSPPPADISACIGCIIPGMGTCPGGSIDACIACTGGGGGGGTCNMDGTCDAAEMSNPLCSDCLPI